MFDLIRKNKVSKVVACYLAVQLVGTIVAPTAAYALTSGPSQPEFNSFTPIGTSDMVSLSSGDFNYNIPIMDVGGYPLNLSYDSGVTMDQEASWVGLGWNLNVGQITRNVRGIPDDFDGDAMRYENNRRDDITIGGEGSIQFPIFGFDFIDLSANVSVQNNNYNGVSANVSLGPSFDISDRTSVGLRFGGTSSGGASVSPNISITAKDKGTNDFNVDKITGNLGVTYDSQKGLSSFNISASRQFSRLKATLKGNEIIVGSDIESGGAGGSFPLNDYLTFTPKSDLSFNNTNLSLSLGLGTELIVTEGPQPMLKGWASYQNLPDSEKDKYLPAFGYENTENANDENGILDFNREKDRVVTENTKALAPTNYTYDTYQILGQGLQGSFRAHRNKVGNVYDNRISSSGFGGSFGAELSVPSSYFHGGLDIEVNPSSNTTGKWNIQNDALEKLNNSFSDGNDLSFEPFHYKMGSDWAVDDEYDDEAFNYFDDKPLMIDISSGNSTEFKRVARKRYQVKNYNTNGTINYETKPLKKIERQQREKRGTAIRKVTNKEARNEGLIANRNESFVKDHHTAGYVTLKGDGSTYVYGESAYNTKKIEATFSVSGENAICVTGLVPYTDQEASIGNNSGRDHFFNKVTTPAYAHSFLLTSVLSSDYEDLTNNGPTIDDLGSFTKINYTSPRQYNWRVPLVAQRNVGSYNAGLNTDIIDQKANYIYGEKELKYVENIETKTHVAFFYLSDRKDGLGAINEHGGISVATMKKIDSISLYNRFEYEDKGETAVPIKVAHFEYDYEMAPGVANNNGQQVTTTGNEYDNQGGKLTLKKLYFTYRKSKMGAYTPYSFEYVETDRNPEYNLKAYDTWGVYKENVASSCDIFQSELTPTEFPYTSQNKITADRYATSWTLSSIDLPSGGKLSVEQESDDYGFVQDKKAMQMFKVVGVGTNSNPTETQLNGTKLYDGSDFSRYLYVKLPSTISENGNSYTSGDFYNDFLKNNYNSEGDIGYSRNNLMHYRFLVNMTKNTSNSNYDYVTGYVELGEGSINVFNNSQGDFVALPIVFQDKEGGLFGSNEQVNPISKSGWYFARKYLNKQVYGLNAGETDGDFEDAIKALKTSLSEITTIFGGPNQALKAKNIASTFIPNKSWIRLYEPSGFKYGGGARVHKIVLDDQWDVMTGNQGNSRFNEQYGQEYAYVNDDGKSSGVATFEPNGSKENPFVLPIFDDPVKIIAPMESNYVEKPLGESFFPAAQVTYGKVTVKNLDKSVIRGDNTTNQILSKHATGEVITEFYTSKDFPTIADFTDPTVIFDKTGPLGNFLKVKTRNHLAMSQGIVVHTNDMNGKMKKQRVRSEGQEDGEFISGVDYNYFVDESGKLDNTLPVIDKDGTVGKKRVAVNYDMINDFRLSKSKSQVLGADGNLGVVPLLFGVPLPVITVLPNYRDHQNVLKMATTTKVVQTTGILKEKIAYDLGSQVSTRNLAWDENTGKILLTEVDNEYGDKYYNFTYPAYWHHRGMATASKNIGVEGVLKTSYDDGDGDNESLFVLEYTGEEQAQDIFIVGDQLMVEPLGQTPSDGSSSAVEKLWVSQVSGNTVRLMDRDGNMINQSCTSDDLVIDHDLSFKVIRSGYKNLEMASMASVTSQENPIDINNDGTLNSLMPTSFEYDSGADGAKVVNASAVIYKDYWQSQDEKELPPFPTSVSESFSMASDINVQPVIDPQDYGFNPYLYNVRGEWRAVKSYAYLTGRDAGTDISTDVSTREQGFFNDFAPFYQLNAQLEWEIEADQWRFASEVTKMSPYGLELENMDALKRFSSAQYGYNYTLPVAVSSNSEYREMGYDGFEDYLYGGVNLNQKGHFVFADAIRVSEEESHTGRYSLKMSSRSIITYDINLTDSLYEVEQPQCDDDTPQNNEAKEQSMRLTSGKKYVISAWVKEISPTDIQRYQYDGISLLINGTTTLASGPIIDGWQQLTTVVTIPDEPVFSIKLATVNAINIEYYVDDIRIHPLESNMKSFSYDPVTQWLMAELDENNYATFYEYDKEGGLVRVKKETEDGIYTIQETRSKTVISE